MTISIQRGRQFLAGDATAAVFDGKGKAGTYLSRAAEKLVAQGHVVTLQSGRKTAVTLATAEDWKLFLSKNCTTAEQAAQFGKRFGVSFPDFLEAMDDLAASDEKGLKLDLAPKAALAQALSLDKVEGDYASKLAKDAVVNLTGVDGHAVTAKVTSAPAAKIGADILATPIGADWERDRTEMENWADFKVGDGAAGKFKESTGPAPYVKLTNPKWDDPEAMKLVEAFALPLHLETKGTNPDGTTKFQDGYEMFRDTYYEGKNGELGKSGAALRARVRFDNQPPYDVNRVLIQAKEGRAVAGTDSAVHKFEKRWEGAYTQEEGAKAQLVSGRDEEGQPLKVMQKVYQLAKDKGALAADGNLELSEKYVVLQKRRRTHLQLDSVGEVQNRRAALGKDLDALKAAGQPVPEAMQKYADKLDAQVKLLTGASELLKKYGQWMPSGECFIISADRYNVYDATARKGNVPNDIDDEAGRLGRGPLHLEAEWDSQSSDPFQKALKEINKRLAEPAPKLPEPAKDDDLDLQGTPATPTTPVTPPPVDPAAVRAQLEADKKALEELQAVFRKDVAQTVNVIKQGLVARGLTEDPEKKSKEQHAQDIAAAATRQVYWY